MDPELIAAIQKAMAAGKSTDDIKNALIGSGYGEDDVTKMLAAAQKPKEPARPVFLQDLPLERISDRQAANRLLLEGGGATLGLIHGPWMPNAIRQRYAQARQETPHSMLYEGLGSSVVPGVGILSRVAEAKLPVSWLGRVAAGMLTGGAVGGVAGASEAPTMRDIPETGGKGLLLGGTIGGATAGLLSVPNEMSRLFGKVARARVGRVAGAAEATLPAEQLSMDAARNANQARILEIRNRYYKPLDEAGALDIPEINQVINDNPMLKDLMPKEVRSGARGPHFKELQGAMEKLRKAESQSFRFSPVENQRFTEARAALENAMSSSLPGYAEAAPLYRDALAIRDASELGWKMYGKPAADVRSTIAKLPTEDAQNAFRQSQVRRMVSKLRIKDATHPSQLARITEAGPEVRDQLRAMFPDDMAYARFANEVKAAHNAMEVAKVIRTVAPWLIVGMSAFGGGAFGVSVLRTILE